MLLPIATEPTTLDGSAGTRAEDHKLPEYDVCPMPTAASAPPAGVAQLVEQRIRNAKVGSSTLFTGTKFQKATLAVAFCFSGAASALLPPAASHAGALPRMSGKGFGLPFLPRPRCSQARRNPEQHSPQLSTPAPSSSALNPSHGLRWVGTRHPSPVTRHPSPVTRHPSPNYQINHSLIFQPTTTQHTNQSHLNIQTDLTITSRSITT